MGYVAQKRLKHGDGFIEAGQEIPEKDYSFITLEQMVRLGDIKLVVKNDESYFAACPNFAACQKLIKELSGDAPEGEEPKKRRGRPPAEKPEETQ